MIPKFATGIWLFSGTPDPYCVDGYREPVKIQEALAAITKVKSIAAVEIRQSDVTPEMPVKELRRIIKDSGLACSAVSATLAQSRRFALAAFAHQHQKTRNSAIDEGRKAVDMARAMGATEVTLRLYSDGFDYPFHIDYTTQWNTIISSIKTIAKYASPDVNVAIAYKPREPRKYLTIASVGKALSMCQEIAMKNVGVAMNFSHAMMAGENPAESVAFLARSTKLFQVYLSDCHSMGDDQLVAGGVHLWETLEALYYLKVSKFKGYLTIDMFPRQIEPTHALQIATGNISILCKKLEKLDTSELRRAQRTMDATESQRIIRRVMLQA